MDGGPAPPATRADEVATPLARRPYDLRHAGVWTWLNAGVPSTQVAEWAGHSVAVPHQIYAKTIVGQDEVARRRISAVLGTETPDNFQPGSRRLNPAICGSTSVDVMLVRVGTPIGMLVTTAS